MLSYKLKHLCSQVFASLAAFGLFSLGSGETRAAVQGTGTTFNFAGKAQDFTVTASWSNQCTVPSTFKGIQGGTYDSGYCTYTCKAGYYYRNGSGDASTVGGQTGSGSNGGSGSGSSAVTYVPAADCYPKPTSCATGIWNEANVYINKTLKTPTIEFAAGSGYYCKATCLDGFVSSTTSTGSFQKSAYATSTAQLTVPACVGNKYIMTIDCGDGWFEGSSSHKGSGLAYYGKKITLPGSGACSWSGHVLDGFDVPSTAISK